MSQHLTPAQIQLLIARIPELPLSEKVALLEQIEASETASARALARTDFLVFCHRVYPGFKEGPHHRHLKPLLHDMARDDYDHRKKKAPTHAKRMTVSMAPRMGKALALDTEVPTPDRGFVRMGDLQVGDRVFAVDGSVTQVTWVSPVWRDRPVCRVTTNDGFSVVADEAHEWSVVKDRKHPRWSTVSTRYVLQKTTASRDARALRIPLQGAAVFDTKKLAVHPYVLGAWLGDGRTDSAAMCTADDFIFDKINALEPGGYTEYARSGKTRHWRPGPLGKGNNSKSDRSLHGRLRQLGLLNNKHIPQEYLTADVEQRRHLLQGLMDTDGAVGKSGCCTFYSTNETLARQTQELVQSLGTKASLASGPAKLNGQQFGTCWRVNFFMKEAASLPRKADRCRTAERTVERYIRAESAGTADTVCIEVAHPRHLFLCTRGYIPTHNSETIAYLYVAWYLGHNPSHQIIMGTHTEELSSGFGRKVRDLLDTAEYRAIFPETQVSKDKSAAGNWTTTAKGVYLALGINSSAAGKGAHLFVADDLVSEQAVLANPDEAFEKAWTFLQVGPLQRLMPGGRIIMIGCMTAETRVLMADGSEKELQHIQVGDDIATYDAGRISVSKVTNWIKHRPDFIYKIRTTSGKIVRANERHPFLVDRDGARTWVRVRDLKVGDCLVETARPSSTGASGEGSNATLTGVVTRSVRKGSAIAATARRIGEKVRVALQKLKSAVCTCGTGTESTRKTMSACSPNRADAAPSADSHQPKPTHGPAGNRSSTSTTVTTQGACGGSSVITATSRSDMPSPSPYCLPLPHTYEVTTAPIVEITKDGFEPVFDMEVERTENFIANGVVSHNTRWGKKDPIGRAVQWARENEDALPWHEIKFPAVMEVEREGVQTLVSLWPEQWPLEELLAKKSGMQPQFWNAQYLQEPTNEEGSIIKREWWCIWPHDEPPECEFTIQTWDTAHDTKSTNDYSACQTWGVFFLESEQRYALILLNAFHKRMEFPDLKARAKREHDEWKPDALVIEKKAAGAPLIQELRRMGLFIEEVSPSRGTNLVSKDKRARLNAIAPVFQDGAVWVPDKRWAREVIELCAEFPNGEFDDPVDCVEMAVSRFRRGNFVRLTTDDNSDNDDERPRTLDYY